MDAIKAKIKEEIAEATAFADVSPPPDGAGLYDHNYSEGYPFIRD